MFPSALPPKVNDEEQPEEDEPRSVDVDVDFDVTVVAVVIVVISLPALACPRHRQTLVSNPRLVRGLRKSIRVEGARGGGVGAARVGRLGRGCLLWSS